MRRERVNERHRVPGNSDEKSVSTVCEEREGAAAGGGVKRRKRERHHTQSTKKNRLMV